MHGPMWRAMLECVKRIELRDTSAHALPDAQSVIALWRITFMLRKVLISVSEWPWQREIHCLFTRPWLIDPSHKTYTCQFVVVLIMKHWKSVMKRENPLTQASFLIYWRFFEISHIITHLFTMKVQTVYTVKCLNKQRTLLSCSQSFLFADAFWFRKTTTDPHIFDYLIIKSGYELYKIKNLYLRNAFK